MRRTHAHTVSIVTALAIFAPAVAHPGLHHDIDRVSRQLLEKPDDVGLLVERGFLLRLEGHADDSLRDLSRARELDPANLQVALQLGFTLSALGRDTDAEAELNRHIEGGDPAPNAYAERGFIKSRTNRVPSAIEDLSIAIAGTDDVDLYLARGRLHESIGQLDQAAAGYRAGLARTHGAVALRLASINIEVQRGQYQSALSLIDEVLPQANVKTNWLLGRASVLAAAGRNDDAHAQRQRALAEADLALARNASSINLFSRAKVLTALGRTADAIRDLHAALIKSPRYTEARSFLETLERQADGALGGRE